MNIRTVYAVETDGTVRQFDMIKTAAEYYHTTRKNISASTKQLPRSYIQSKAVIKYFFDKHLAWEYSADLKRINNN